MSEMRDGSRYRHNFPPACVYILGEDIGAGEAVTQSNQSNNRIVKADADIPNRMPSIGALLETKLMGQEGLVVPFGMMPNLVRTEDFEAGDQIYISGTRGKFTKTQPVSGTIQVVGEARNKSSALLFCVPPQIPVSYGYVFQDNHTILEGDGTTEKKFLRAGDDPEFTVTHHGMLWASFDLTALEAEGALTVTARLYHLIDETTLRVIDRKHKLIGSDEEHLVLSGPVTSGKTIGLSLQVSAAVTEPQAIPHALIQDT